MNAKRLVLAAAGASAATVVGAGAASADMMHPTLAARLAGMGEHGIVNLRSQAAKGKLCWTFELSTKGVTGASIRDAHGMKVAMLGSAYAPKSCAQVTKKALGLVETKPGAYWIWVDTKGHPGELRGRLFAGMAHM
ncbi:MAG TPA: hypothetical protein VGF23_03485 [Gaiellaceae bacterium]|jgi:hypothetical protein